MPAVVLGEAYPESGRVPSLSNMAQLNKCFPQTLTLTFVDPVFLLLLLLLLFGLEHRPDHSDRVHVPVDGMSATPGGRLRLRPL